MDTDGGRVNAHGGGIIQVGDTFYMHGEYFSAPPPTTTSTASPCTRRRISATWKNEGIILPQQPSGELGPNRKGERPHIIQCPSTGEFVLYAHAGVGRLPDGQGSRVRDFGHRERQIFVQGPLKNASGAIAAHSDMTAVADSANAYVMTESGHVLTLAG